MTIQKLAFHSPPFRSVAVLLALSLPSAVLAQAASPVAVSPVTVSLLKAPPQATQVRPADSLWTHAGLQAATYVVLAPSLEGSPSALSADQQRSVLSAMQRDLQGAMLRRYPAAKFVTDASTPGVITLRPVLTVPASLLPWNSFQARVELSRSGSSAVVRDNFGVLEVYSHQSDAANYLFDRLASKLP